MTPDFFANIKALESAKRTRTKKLTRITYTEFLSKELYTGWLFSSVFFFALVRFLDGEDFGCLVLIRNDAHEV